MPGYRRRRDETQLHCVDGAPVPIVATRSVVQRNQPKRARIDLDTVEAGEPSAAYAGPRDVMLNNFVSTARLSNVVPNLIAMSVLSGGEHHVGRHVKMCTRYAHITAHAKSGVLNIAGARSPEQLLIAVYDYQILAARTGTALQLRTVGTHNIQTTLSFGAQLDLAGLADRYRGGGLRRPVINFLSLHCENPHCTLNLFPTGKAVLLSLKTLDGIEKAVSKTARIVAPYVVQPSLPMATLRYNERTEDAQHRVLPSIGSLYADVSSCILRRRDRTSAAVTP